MKPRYEEKTFENYFNTELANKSDVYFPFGQVQEGGMGADSSAYSQNQDLWGAISNPEQLIKKYEGESLPNIAKHMNNVLGAEINNIPDIKTNILFQYKRPELITTSRGAEWKYWNKKYFRYNIYKDQQLLLEKIATTFGSKVLALYASPALETVNDLVNAMIEKRIIETTNFRPALDLSIHHRNTYIRAGNYSIACSDPERQENFDLLKHLNKLEPSANFNIEDDIIKLSNDIQDIVRKSNIGETFNRRINAHDKSFLQFPILQALIAMGVIRELTGIQWVVSAEVNRPSKPIKRRVNSLPS